MKNTLLLTALAAFLSVASTANAETVLQLDLGTASGAYVGNLAPAGVTDTTWNQIANVDNTTGLFFGDGTAATGVVADIGATDENSATGIVSFANTGRGEGGNLTNLDAIYNTDLTTDWIFTRRNADLAIAVSGLAPGVYDVYAYTKEPNELTRTYDVSIGTVASANLGTQTLETVGLAGETTSIGDATGTTTFVDGTNFALTRVTVADVSDSIVVVVDPTNEQFSTLGAVQIVGVSAIPEPSSLALLSLGGLGFVLRRRR